MATFRTLRDVSRERGIPYTTLAEAAAARQFPTTRLTPRGIYRVTLEDIDAWLASRTIPAVRSAPTRPPTPEPPPSARSAIPPVSEWDERLM